MPTTRIITDSTACIPPELVERYRIEVVPLHIIFGGRTFTDSMTTGTSEFYELLRTSGDRPTTAAPSPGMFLSAIARASTDADAILCITVSKQFSAMYDAARQAIAMSRSESPALDIRLLDSRNAAMAQGFVVLEAARAAQRGDSIDAVVERAESMTTRVSLVAMLDTLTYLARGGRVPRVAAWAAGIVQLNPIVRFSADGIKLIARTRTRQRALDRMAQIVIATAGARATHLAVHHANAETDGRYLLDRIASHVDLAESHITEFTQVMGVHTGPGLTGVAMWSEDA